jgi:ABC-type phosphate transport system substrate-binding protein
MVRNLKVAAAVAAVLASSSAFAQGQPTPAQASSSSAISLYIAGSSAAKNAVLAALETTSSFCNNVYSIFNPASSGDTNFYAVSCEPTTSSGLPSANGSQVYTFYYRDEGGSVTGALPLVTGSLINQMSLSGATGSGGSYTVSIPGSSATNGIDDSFASGVFKAPVQLGITDVEPGALIVNNYPSAYKTSVYGHATAAQLANLKAKTLFDQVFGIFVNTNSSLFSTAEKSGQGTSTASLALPLQSITNILQGNSIDWGVDVNDLNGNVVASSSLPITIINREQGSGSRTATDIFFTSDSCNKVSQLPIVESTGGTADYFSTGNVLAAANTIPGAITYASIDNAGSSFPNMTLVAIDGVQPSNLAAAAGEYGDWYEATAVTGSNYSSLTSDQQQAITFLISAFQTKATVPGGVDILANPNYNATSLPITGTASVNSGKTIYVNPFTRGGISCNVPANQI